jgi:hypothetical protein
MPRILRVDHVNGGQRIVKTCTGDMFDSVVDLVTTAQEECNELPNNPRLVQCEDNGISVVCGVYRLLTFYVVE